MFDTVAVGAYLLLYNPADNFQVAIPSDVMNQERSKKEFVHISGILKELLKKYRSEPDGELARVWQLWDGIVGEAIAENARPAAFKGSLLLVYVTNSTWVHHLQFLKQDIIEKLNAAVGQKLVEDIKFKIGSF